MPPIAWDRPRSEISLRSEMSPEIDFLAHARTGDLVEQRRRSHRRGWQRLRDGATLAQERRHRTLRVRDSGSTGL